MNLLIYTCNVGTPDQMKMLSESCKVYGYDLNVYDSGEESYVNNRQIKIDHNLKYLKKLKSEYVLFTDAWDSWMLGSPEKLIRKYQRHFAGKVVVAGNRDLSSRREEDKDKFESKSSYKYICSGSYIGPRLKIIECLERMDKLYKERHSDQLGWIKLYLSDPKAFIIDSQCRLFQTMTLVYENDFILENKKWYNTETRTNPLIVHFAGPKGNSPNAVYMRETFDKWLRNNR